MANLKLALSRIHIPSLQEHSEEYPYRISDLVEHCWMEFDSVVRGAEFHLDDKNLNQAIYALHSAWGRSLAYPHEYHANPGGTAYVFMRYDDPVYMAQDDHEKHWDEMNQARTEIQACLQRLLAIVHERYIELDVREMSYARWDEYREWRMKLTKSLSRSVD